MSIHDLPKKWRDGARGDAAALACANELEAHLKDAELCFVTMDMEVRLEVIVPDKVFMGTMKKPTSLTISTKSGDTRTASLLFD